MVRDENLKLEEVKALHTLGGAGKGIPKEGGLDRRREICDSNAEARILISPQALMAACA